MAGECGYIAEHAEMTAACAPIGRVPGPMIQSPEKPLTSAALTSAALTSDLCRQARLLTALPERRN
jgi:hypothetical protein